MESELWPNLIMSAAAKGVSGFFVNLEHDQVSVHDRAHFLSSSMWTDFSLIFHTAIAGLFVWVIYSVRVMLQTVATDLL